MVTQANRSKKKGDIQLVMLKSSVSEYKTQGRRSRLGEKVETMMFDPFVQQKVLFREVKKVKTINSSENVFWNKPQIIEYPEHFKV